MCVRVRDALKEEKIILVKSVYRPKKAVIYNQLRFCIDKRGKA